MHMFHLRKEIFIDMDQSAELVELNLLLRMVNYSGSNSIYNFSDAEALSLIRDYMKAMYTFRRPSTIALICLYIPVFLMSLGGNGLVIFVVFRNQHMRRVKNLFLVNLALADLLVTLVCMPMVVGQIIFRLWVYGEVMCKVTAYMQGVAVTSSIFTLTALSIDRYFAIKAPMSLRRISGKCQAARFLGVIWLLSGIFIGPVIYVRSVYSYEFDRFQITMSYCIERWPKNLDRKAYGLFLLTVTYISPIVIIAVCYMLIGKTLCSGEFHRKNSDSSSTVMLGRKRVARMLIALIAVFMLCWLPYNVCSLSLDMNADFQDTRFLPFTLWCGHAHSAVNPILYWFLNKSFRHCMRKALRCEVFGKSRKDSPTPQSPGPIGEILKFGLPRHTPPQNGRHSRSPLNPQLGTNRRVIRLKIRHQSSTNSKSHSQTPSLSSGRGPGPDKHVVHVAVTPTTLSSRMNTTTSGQQPESQSGLSLEVHYQSRGCSRSEDFSDAAPVEIHLAQVENPYGSTDSLASIGKKEESSV